MSACNEPIAFEALVALWAADLPEAEVDRLEQHLFECDACAARCDALAPLLTELRALIPPVITHAHRDRLLAEGVRIVQTDVSAGQRASARFAPGVDLLVHVLHADLARARRVDVDLVSSEGAPRASLEGVAFDAARGEVLIACQRHYESMFAAGEAPRFVLHVTEGSERKLAGEFVVEHIWR